MRTIADYDAMTTALVASGTTVDLGMDDDARGCW
jgi:hypothetical protein